MELKLDHLDRIVEMLSEKTGQPLDLIGFGVMSERIGAEKISKKYLYETLHLNKEKARKKKLKKLNLHITKLDTIAKFLGFDNIRDLIEEIEQPVNNILLECVGNYYNYVRRNTKDTVIFRSPVSIYRDKTKIYFRLRGPASTYTGQLHYREGCLSVVMQADNGKMIHHVYRVGKAIKPKVIQGIFSGVSTTFDPIGGRTVLVRVDEKPEALKNRALTARDLKTSTIKHEKKLLPYFSRHETNNLSISSVGKTFTTDDLV